MITKIGSLYSHVHTIMSLLKGSSPNANEVLIEKANERGSGQMDERLTLTAFSRAIKRVEDDADNGITNAAERALRILQQINSDYNPKEIRCISLTFGLQQSTVVEKIPQGKDKNGKDKQPIEKKTLQNKAGQDMFILLICRDDPTFTKEFCDFAVSATKLFEHNVKLWQKHALSFLKKSDSKATEALKDLQEELTKIFPLISKESPDGLFRPPIWTDFLPFGRKSMIEKYRKKYLATLPE